MALPVKSLTLLAVLGSVTLVGCGSNDNASSAESATASETSVAATAEASAESTGEATAEVTADSTESYAQAEGEVDPLASPSTCATPSLEPIAAQVPEGTQLVTAVANKISLAVPTDWVAAAPGAEDGVDQMNAYMDATGVSEMNKESMQAQIQQLDLLASAKDANDKGYRENISVYASPMSTACEPSEDTLREVVGRNYGSANEYKVEATSLGEAPTVAYVLANSNGIPVYGKLLVIPVPDSDTDYAMVNIATLDEAKTADLSQQVLESVQAAQ